VAVAGVDVRARHLPTAGRVAVAAGPGRQTGARRPAPPLMLPCRIAHAKSRDVKLAAREGLQTNHERKTKASYPGVVHRTG